MHQQSFHPCHPRRESQGHLRDAAKAGAHPAEAGRARRRPLPVLRQRALLRRPREPPCRAVDTVGVRAVVQSLRCIIRLARSRRDDAVKVLLHRGDDVRLALLDDLDVLLLDRWPNML